MRHLLIIFPFVVATAARSDLIAFDSAAIFHELHLEKHVRILEETFLERDNHKLRRLEVLLDHQPNVLSVTQV